MLQHIGQLFAILLGCDMLKYNLPTTDWSKRMITFRCDACGTSMIARPDRVGGQQTCPMCGGIVVVPEVPDPDATPIKVEATQIGMFTYQLECLRCHGTQNIRPSFFGTDTKCRNYGFNMFLPPRFSSFDLGIILFAVLSIVVMVILGPLDIVFSLFIVLPAFFVYRSRNRKEAFQLIEDAITASVKKHLDTLALKYLHLVRPDEYKTVCMMPWAKHLKRFIDDLVRPNLPRGANHFFTAWVASRGATFISEITRFIRVKSESLVDSEDKVEAMSGIEFEAFCMKRLQDAGWEVRSTKATGDQGVDIIARKNAVSIAIQCKRAAHAVGNAAVQEVFAGSKHFRTDHAAVISNSPYTNSAQELAYSTNVLLLHYSDITKLDAILGREE